jgi:hypothetical protein
MGIGGVLAVLAILLASYYIYANHDNKRVSYITVVRVVREHGKYLEHNLTLYSEKRNNLGDVILPTMNAFNSKEEELRRLQSVGHRLSKFGFKLGGRCLSDMTDLESLCWPLSLNGKSTKPDDIFLAMQGTK